MLFPLSAFGTCRASAAALGIASSLQNEDQDPEDSCFTCNHQRNGLSLLQNAIFTAWKSCMGRMVAMVLQREGKVTK